MGAEQSSQQQEMARSAPMSAAQSPSKNNSGSSTNNMWSSHSSHQNNLDVPMGRQRSKSESGARHFADFSLFPDRYDAGGGMNRSSTMNEGFSSSSNRGHRNNLGSMPEEPQKWSSHTDRNFLKKQQSWDYSHIPEKDTKTTTTSNNMWGTRMRMSSTGDDIPRDAARHDGNKSPGAKHFFDFSMFPDKMDPVSARRN